MPGEGYVELFATSLPYDAGHGISNPTFIKRASTRQRLKCSLTSHKWVVLTMDPILAVTDFFVPSRRDLGNFSGLRARVLISHLEMDTFAITGLSRRHPIDPVCQPSTDI
jgi:hypothetical protein